MVRSCVTPPKGAPPVVSTFPGKHDQEVAAEGGELVHDVAPRPLAERRESDHRRDPHRHPGDRERGAQPVPPERPRGKRQQVEETHPTHHPASPRARRPSSALSPDARTPDALDRAVVHPNHALRPLRDRGIVGDDDEGEPLRVHPLEQLHHLTRRGPVEVPGRLVGQQDRRVHHHRPRDRHPLTLAAGELVGPMVRAVGEPHGLQRQGRALAALLRGRPGEEHRELDVAERREARQQVEELEDEADPVPADQRALLLRKRADLAPLQQVAPARRPVEAAHDVQQGGLARPRGAHERDVLAALDREAHVLEGVHLPFADPVYAPDLVELDHPASRARARAPGLTSGESRAMTTSSPTETPPFTSVNCQFRIPVLIVRSSRRSFLSTSTFPPSAMAAVGMRGTPSRRARMTSTSADVPGSRVRGRFRVLEIHLDLDGAVLLQDVEHVRCHPGQPAGELLPRERVDRHPHLLPDPHALGVHLVDGGGDVHGAGVDEVEHGRNRNARWGGGDPLPHLGAAVRDHTGERRAHDGECELRVRNADLGVRLVARRERRLACRRGAVAVALEGVQVLLAGDSVRQKGLPPLELLLGELGGKTRLPRLRLRRFHLLVGEAHAGELDGVVELEEQGARLEPRHPCGREAR